MKRALVLGGYGLIGSACMRALDQAGFQVRGLGRSARAAQLCDRRANWTITDMTRLTARDWHALLRDCDVVVNAAGALQDGGRDDLRGVHVTALEQLVQGAADLPVRIIQISAAGVSHDASTLFFRTKAEGDAAVATHSGDWVILRPTLVLSPEAYGGTALLHAASGLPGVLPRMFPKSQVQTIHIDDLARAVVAAARGEIASGTVADLTEGGSHSFPDLLRAIRHWQGWPDPLWRPALPGLILRAAAKVADLLGHLGWRAPMRSTAMTVLADGISGDPSAWQAAGGSPCRSLQDSLRSLPATRQERMFARLYLLLPMAIGVLSLFWCLSGLITLLDPGRAMAVLSDRGFPSGLIAPVVVGGALADLALGLGILWRRWSRRAALGMVALSCAYLLGSLIAAPDLWGDPLGPMVKVLPGVALALMVWGLLEDR
ncbi:MAG: SDR family oxidoreductase [Rhodobacteraceae bacterium]|nr:SDR family oxidoreductase [Paracoccaceae bacterium]